MTETTTETIIANVIITLLVKIVKNVSHFTTIDRGEGLLDVPLTPAEVRDKRGKRGKKVGLTFSRPKKVGLTFSRPKKNQSKK